MNSSRESLRRAGAVLSALACASVLAGQSPAHASPGANARSATSTSVAGQVAAAGRVEGPTPTGVPAFQTARNRQVKTRVIDYVRVCPDCVSGKEVPPSYRSKQASARIRVTASTYKILDQNNRYDFYAVDVTSEMRKRKGDQDWGWYDVVITSVGRTKLRGTSYSAGRNFENVDRCTSFPVDLGVSFYGVSAGTTVGNVSFCNKGSRMLHSKVAKGRKYHATGVSGIRSVQGQRYVRVPQGKLPKFRVQLVTNKDRFFCYTVSDGTHCRVDHLMQSKALTIGTTRQKK